MHNNPDEFQLKSDTHCTGERYRSRLYSIFKTHLKKYQTRRLVWKTERSGRLGEMRVKMDGELLTGQIMRTVIKDRKSSWNVFLSGVPK